MVTFHFKDGTSEVIDTATAFRPMQNPDGSVNNEFVEALDDLGNRKGLAPVASLNCAEKA